MNKNNQFLSCDWGTTAFRLRLVSADGNNILGEVSSKQGIASTYDQWCKRGKEEKYRLGFYQTIISEHLKELEAKAGSSLNDCPLLISGMASSNIGMVELPYKPMPFALDGSDLSTKTIPPSEWFPYTTLLISGVQTDDDVMRGEEVQVIGCEIAPGEEELLIIHPGTHCKHIVVKGDQVISFQTYMTGEMFSLLSTKSILAGSVGSGGDIEHGTNREHFEAGLRNARSQNLLHAAFLVRTGSLFRKRNKEESFYYLSGLLIGTELNALSGESSTPIVLAGEPTLTAQYRIALSSYGITSDITIKDADTITIAGQYAVYLQHQMS